MYKNELKTARAKHAKPSSFIVKYANLPSLSLLTKSAVPLLALIQLFQTEVTFLSQHIILSLQTIQIMPDQIRIDSLANRILHFSFKKREIKW